MTATRLDWTESEAGRVAVVTLDLPGKSANLLSSAMLGEIEQRLDEVDAEKVDAVQSRMPDCQLFLTSPVRMRRFIVKIQTIRCFRTKRRYPVRKEG